jgi:YcxB-like protein
MRFEYRLTLNDYQEFNQTHSKQIHLKLGIAYFVIVLLTNGLPLLSKTNLSIQEILLNVILPSLLAGILIFVVFYIIHQFSIKRAWNSAHLGKDETVVEVNDEELTINTPLSRSTLKWAAYTHWKETLNLFLVYQSANCSSLFPKRAFISQEQIDEFRELLRSKLPHQV